MSGVDYKTLYDRSKIRTVQICLDSGKLATEACGKDVRTVLVDDFKRTEDVLVYPEDTPDDRCDVHVTVDYCVTGGGVCTEYCKLFAEVDPELKIEERALVKMTNEFVQELRDAKRHGLEEEYLMDDYVYFVTESGKDAKWEGFNRDLEQEGNAPYKICPAHTQQAWEDYQREQAPGPYDPTNPDDPTNPSNPVGPETGNNGATTNPARR